ncbi:MAG: hypothetical protein QNK19_15890 [Xanthomonadales bacterium]|nr:hypothetical protein [Xanthomonadales bacterium]
MSKILNSTQPFQKDSLLCRVLAMISLLLLLSFTGSLLAAQSDSKDQATDTETNQASEYAEEMAEATEEVNTNDPTAAAISVSFGWEFFDWHDDEIAPGQTRPQGNDNNFNSRIVMPLAAGTLGSPWPIINRFSFANVKAAGGTSGSGNAEFISLFIPKTWATGKIGIGPALNLPADEKQFGANVWRYGIAGVALENSLEGRLMWGVLVRQVWGKTDPNSNKVLSSPFALQPIAVYQLTDGWYLSNGESAIAYNWQKNEWLIPLGIRLGKTIKDRKGGTWNMYGEYRTNVVYKDWPGAAAKNIFRISASYTFSN